MTSLEALILGMLQGLTEFIPVSSSGHLVLVEALFSLSLDPRSLQGFDVVLHGGTLLALLFCYRNTWKNIFSSLFQKKSKESSSLLQNIILATIPIALGGIFFEEWIAQNLRTPMTVSFAFLLTAAALLIGEYWNTKHKKRKEISPLLAFCIGIAQVFALAPGISRSGATISTGLASGLSRKHALDFSFLIATPAFAGAVILTGIHAKNDTIFLPSLSITTLGFLASFFTSICTIYFLRKWVLKHSFLPFALYLAIAAGALLF